MTLTSSSHAHPTAQTEREENVVNWSVALIIIPTMLWMALIAPALYESPTMGPTVTFIFGGLILAFLLSSLGFLVAAMVTEPGILEPEEAGSDTDGEGSYLDRPRVTHVIVNGQRFHIEDKRAKMCRQTDSCVEQFDHFCPWVRSLPPSPFKTRLTTHCLSFCAARATMHDGRAQVGNAIGRRNYRLFIGFLTSVVFLTLLVNVSTILRIICSMVDSDDSEKSISGFFSVASRTVLSSMMVVFTLLILCSLCGLWAFHLWLISVAQTTYEKIQGRWKDRPNPYDKGCLKNFQRFLTEPMPPSRVAELDPTHPRAAEEAQGMHFLEFHALRSGERSEGSGMAQEQELV